MKAQMVNALKTKHKQTNKRDRQTPNLNKSLTTNKQTKEQTAITKNAISVETNGINKA